MRGFICSAALVALTFSSGAAAADAIQPTGKWVVDFSDAQCVASRQYGDDHLVVKVPPLGEVVQLALLTKGRVGSPEQTEGSLRVNGGAPIKVSALVFSSAGSRGIVHSINLPLERFAQVRSGKMLNWRFPRAPARTLALLGLDKLMTVMDECVAGLRKVWNVRRQSVEALPEAEDPPLPQGWTPARGDLMQWIKDDDYPGVAIYGNQTGNVSFALLVNEEGRVADCTVVRTSGVAALDAQSCILLKQRAKLEPARDAAGKPVKDSMIGHIRWRLSGY